MTHVAAPPIRPQIPGEGVHSVTKVLPGLDKRAVFKDLCGKVAPARFLAEARILCYGGDGYPRVDDHTGHVLCPEEYLTSHEPMVVYLDMVHELVHVRQVLEGKPIYHFPKAYVEWPTEIEAYRISYQEARRIGVADEWFWEYLEVPWVDRADLERLAASIGLAPLPKRPKTASKRAAKAK